VKTFSYIVVAFSIVACFAVACAGVFAAIDEQTVFAVVSVDAGEDPVVVIHLDATDNHRGACPSGMAEVDGDYCSDVREVCLRWVDREGNAIPEAIPGPAASDLDRSGRCAEWEFPTRCVGSIVHKHYCIDLYEYPNVAGAIPRSWMNWYDGQRACAADGKRLCTRAEWTLACEGPNMMPYPYGEGYRRDSTACNIDNTTPVDSETGKKVSVFDATSHGTRAAKLLDGMLKPSGSMPACVSPYGVYDMVGNLDEQVVNTSGHPHWSGLMGGHVFGVRNACRPMTDAHDENFGWYETTARCCKSIGEK